MDNEFCSENTTQITKNKKSNYEMRRDLINYVKENGLTIRQAQKLFIECTDHILYEIIL